MNKTKSNKSDISLKETFASIEVFFKNLNKILAEDPSSDINEEEINKGK